MTDEIKDGGMAFPSSVSADGFAECGMSLRDYFAGQAIAGLIQFAADPTRLKPAEMAEAAYRISDALIAQRYEPLEAK